MRMRPFGRLLPVSEAVRRLQRAIVPVRGTDRVALVDGLGRVAARTYRAGAAVPSFSRATWDGYALRSHDTRKATSDRPVALRVVGEIFAEDSLGRPLRPGEAAAIATGGAVPRGADAVLIFEETRPREEAIEVARAVRRGERIAEPGDDFRRGQSLVHAGDVLGPASLGALAATGRREVDVVRRPVVAIVPNGNELVVPGRRLRRGQIYETNNVTLSSLLRAAGADPRPQPPVPDDPRRIEAALRAALKSSDLVLATGGSSVGEHDYLPAIFPKLGRLLFHGIAVRPGKPTLAASAGTKLLVGMPGHPTSCLSNGFWMLLPTLRALARLPGPGWIDGHATLADAVEAPTRGLATVVPLRVEKGVAHTTFRDSSAITSLAGVNAFALLPPGAAAVARGSPISIRILPPPLGVTPADAASRVP